jgi:hypothetical protein
MANMENSVVRMSMAVAATAGVVLAGCGAASEPAPNDGVRLEVVETERGPVSLDGYGATLIGPDELAVDLPSCNGDPVLDVLEEDDDEVRIRVVTRVVVSGEDNACADVVEVPLDRPLDDRTVVDLVSGAAIDIIRYRDAGVELDCFDADYPLEPTFATPEEALADAVARKSQEVEPPDDLADYRRVDRGETVVDFEYRTSDDDFHTWGMLREDERWGMVSLGGCIPAR